MLISLSFAPAGFECARFPAWGADSLGSGAPPDRVEKRAIRSDTEHELVLKEEPESSGKGSRRLLATSLGLRFR